MHARPAAHGPGIRRSGSDPKGVDLAAVGAVAVAVGHCPRARRRPAPAVGAVQPRRLRVGHKERAHPPADTAGVEISAPVGLAAVGRDAVAVCEILPFDPHTPRRRTPRRRIGRSRWQATQRRPQAPQFIGSVMRSGEHPRPPRPAPRGHPARRLRRVSGTDTLPNRQRHMRALRWRQGTRRARFHRPNTPRPARARREL